MTTAWNTQTDHHAHNGHTDHEAPAEPTSQGGASSPRAKPPVYTRSCLAEAPYRALVAAVSEDAAAALATVPEHETATAKATRKETIRQLGIVAREMRG